jgi:hypothetical protein
MGRLLLIFPRMNSGVEPDGSDFPALPELPTGFVTGPAIGCPAQLPRRLLRILRILSGPAGGGAGNIRSLRRGLAAATNLLIHFAKY